MNPAGEPSQSKLKIALVCDWFLPQQGGVEMHLGDLAPRLAQAGHEVHVITPIPGPEAGEGYRVHRLDAPLFPKFRFVWTPSAFQAIEAILKRERFDVVHCHGNIFSPTAYGALYLAKQLGIPALITWASILGPYRWALKILDAGFGWSRWPVGYSAVSDVVAKDVRWLLRGREVSVLPNGLEVNAWKGRPPAGESGGVHLVSVMRLVRKKRAKALLQMLPDIDWAVRKEARVKLTLIGEGPDREDLERLVKSLSLEDSVTLPGHLPRQKMLDIFSTADIYVQPTVWESFGLAALEARCAGLPVVARSQGGVREFIGEGREGLFGRTDAELSAQIVRLIQDRDLRQSIARHNRETAPPLDWNEVLKIHVELYRQTVQNAGRG